MASLPENLAQRQILSGPEVVDFLTATCIYAFDPDTKAAVATATYRADGVVDMTVLAGGADTGHWGMDAEMYWTQYEAFRDGHRHTFYLERLTRDTVQAYFGDGRRAFIQSHRAVIGAEL